MNASKDTSQEILLVLQHALGRDQYGRRNPGLAEDYRNHFCAGGKDVATCRGAVALGLMEERLVARTLSGGDPTFVVTDEGKRYIATHSPAPPKMSRAKKRYDHWLGVRDAIGMSFGEYLKQRMYEG